MASILEIIGQSGAVPMEELKIRSLESPDDVESRIDELESRGIVKVVNDPDLKSAEALSDDRLVTLTAKGLRSSVGR